MKAALVLVLLFASMGACWLEVSSPDTASAVVAKRYFPAYFVGSLSDSAEATVSVDQNSVAVMGIVVGALTDNNSYPYVFIYGQIGYWKYHPGDPGLVNAFMAPTTLVLVDSNLGEHYVFSWESDRWYLDPSERREYSIQVSRGSQALTFSYTVGSVSHTLTLHDYNLEQAIVSAGYPAMDVNLDAAHLWLSFSGSSSPEPVYTLDFYSREVTVDSSTLARLDLPSSEFFDRGRSYFLGDGNFYPVCTGGLVSVPAPALRAEDMLFLVTLALAVFLIVSRLW